MDVLLVISDSVSINLAFWVSWSLTNGIMDLEHLARTYIFTTFVFICIFALNGLYDFEYLMSGTKEYGLIVRGFTFGMVAIVLLGNFQQDYIFSRSWFFISWVTGIFLSGSARFIMRRLLFYLRRSRGWFIQRTLLIGVSEHSIMISRQLIEQSHGVKVVGFLDEFLPVGANVLRDLQVLGTPDQVNKIVSSYNIEQVILFSNAVTWESFRDIMFMSGYNIGFRLYLSPGYYEIMPSGMKVTYKALIPFLKVDASRIQGIDWIIKTTFDYFLGLILFLISLPIILLISVAILISDGRPIFTSHQVLGINGEIFWIRKFRTNLFGYVSRRLDDQQLRAELREIKSGTLVARLLFQTGLDKLPELLSVLSGKLSLVGPRTIVPDNEYYDSQSTHPSLLSVKPGWTGPWAVWGAYTLDEEMRLNLHYIRNWTIWSDFQILFQTFKLALFPRSAVTKNSS